MTQMNTEICWRSSVLTALIIYPQMLDRCYTDFHLFQICLASVDFFFSTEDTDKHGFLFRVFCVFCGFLFHTEGHGRSRMSASGRGGYYLSSELRRNLD